MNSTVNTQVIKAPQTRNVQDEPHSIDSEQALLNAVLDGRDIGSALLEGLEPKHFYRAPYGWVYSAMLDLHTAEKSIDAVTLCERLRERGELATMVIDEYSGADAIERLALKLIVGNQSVRAYAKVIKEKHTRRMMLKAARDLATMAVDEKTAAGIQLDRHARGLVDIRPFDLNREFIPGAQSAEQHAALIQAQAQRQSWHPTPWSVMKDRVPVISDGDIVAILGPEGAGKSIMCANWAQFEASIGNRTVYIHTEMTPKQVLDRRAAGANKAVSFSKLQKPDKMTESDWHALGEAVETIKPWMKNLDYWHAGPIGESKLFMVMQRMVDDFGMRTFVLDGLNDVEPDKQRGENDAAAWRRMMARFEDFTNGNQCVLITSTQLNADGGAYQIGRALKQKAMLYLVLKPEKLESVLEFAHDGVSYQCLPGENNPRVRVDILKHRGGARGSYDLVLVGARYLWVDVPSDFGASETVDVSGVGNVANAGLSNVGVTG